MKYQVYNINPLRLITAFARNRRGIAAVEFALLLPVMLTLYLGVVEITQAVAINRKVTLTTRTVADLASQISAINNAEMTNLLTATGSVIAPFDQSKLKVVVSAVTIDGNGIAKIAWSDTLNGTKRAKDSIVTVPAALKLPNTTLIWSEVNYNYTPLIGHVVTGAINLTDWIYMRPRLSDTVTRINS
jgi:Flp pilus assembly protein TadG